ncbi:unnamed protein product [Phytophthora lilii]|uniref:Unnamed protein product n=1 Tax=Phytophthora lilii TaxID=2077276 RepID=A0A9W6WRA4_9STRA|nr:unnamed protein product [Phytophthora lilii]
MFWYTRHLPLEPIGEHERHGAGAHSALPLQHRAAGAVPRRVPDAQELPLLAAAGAQDRGLGHPGAAHERPGGLLRRREDRAASLLRREVHVRQRHGVPRHGGADPGDPGAAEEPAAVHPLSGWSQCHGHRRHDPAQAAELDQARHRLGILQVAQLSMPRCNWNARDVAGDSMMLTACLLVWCRFTRDHGIEKDESEYLAAFSEEIVVTADAPKWLWNGVRVTKHPTMIVHQPDLELATASTLDAAGNPNNGAPNLKWETEVEKTEAILRQFEEASRNRIGEVVEGIEEVETIIEEALQDLPLTRSLEALDLAGI